MSQQTVTAKSQGPSEEIRLVLNEAQELLKLKSEIGRLPTSLVKTKLIALIDEWFGVKAVAQTPPLGNSTVRTPPPPPQVGDKMSGHGGRSSL